MLSSERLKMLIQWWYKSHGDGSCDYVRLRPGDQQDLEWVEGSYLPPQMPLLKRRYKVSLEAAQQRQQNLLAMGFKPGQPLF
jgi:hypothetical protein